jgi:hypothetical protein
LSNKNSLILLIEDTNNQGSDQKLKNFTPLAAIIEKQPTLYLKQGGSNLEICLSLPFHPILGKVGYSRYWCMLLLLEQDECVPHT